MNKYSPPSDSPLPVAVVGARGYSGRVLARLLQRHPGARVAAAFATEAGAELDLPGAAGAAKIRTRPLADLSAAARDVDTVFLATPADVSAEWAPRLLDAGARVIDLSGAFRLRDATERGKWYGLYDPAPAAEYGLSPWNEAIDASTRIVANPGCYATSILMALLPLFAADLLEPSSIVIDAKSGATGAGRKPREDLLLSELEGECLPYRVGAHQHLPEIRQAVALPGFDPHLTTHLAAFRRGISTAIYGRLRPGFDAAAVEDAFRAAYFGYRLASWTDLDAATPTAARGAVTLRHVVGTARTRLAFRVDADKLYVFSLIDNLMKGAASQAVENFNRLHGWSVETGLTEWEGLV